MEDDPRRSGGPNGTGDGSLIDDDEDNDYRVSMEELLLRGGGGGGGGGLPPNDIMEELHASRLSATRGGGGGGGPMMMAMEGGGSFSRGVDFDSPLRRMGPAAAAGGGGGGSSSNVLGMPGVAMGTLYDDQGPNPPEASHLAASMSPHRTMGWPPSRTFHDEMSSDPPFQDRAGSRPTSRDDPEGEQGGGGSRPSSHTTTTMESAAPSSRRHPNYPQPHAGAAPRASTVRPLEPSAPASRLGRRILTHRPERQPDFVAATLEEGPSRPPLHEEAAIGATPTTWTITLASTLTSVECVTCGTFLPIPKSTVLVLCPVCDEVNPVASCRVMPTAVDG